MKLELKSSGGAVVAILAIAAAAIAFWMLAIGPKRDEVAKLDKQVKAVENSLAQHQLEIAEGEEARREFPSQYQKLVVLGKAVPGDDDTASLLVQITRIAEKNDIAFKTIKLNGEGQSEESATATPAAEASVEPISATEASASLLPLGAKIGPAGLAVMPYTLTFEGSFFDLADFIAELDALVATSNENVSVDGRLVTLDGFGLVADPAKGFPYLQGNFAVTTYVTPPGEGVTGGATPEAPEASLGTPASQTIGATE